MQDPKTIQLLLRQSSVALDTFKLLAIPLGISDLIPIITPASNAAIFLSDNIESLLSGELYGRKVAEKILHAKFLPVELVEDLQDIVDTSPSSKNDYDVSLSEDAVEVASHLVLLFYVIGHLPDTLLVAPKETINFKFGELTLIVDGSLTLRIFNRNSCKYQRIILSAPTSEDEQNLEVTLKQLQWENGVIEQMFVTILVASLSNVAHKLPVLLSNDRKVIKIG